MHTIVISANTSWYLYNFRKNTIIALINEGYRVIVLAPYDNYTDKIIELGALFHNVYIDQCGINIINELRTIKELIIFYRKEEVSLVLNFTPKNNIYNTIIASSFNISIINNISGLGTAFIRKNLLSRVLRLLYKYSQRKSELIFFQNKEDLNLFLNEKIISKEKTQIIPGSGVDLSRFSVRNPTEKKSKELRFLLIARMLYPKGVKHFVEAAKIIKKRYDNVNFLLLGFIDTKNPLAVKKTEIDEWVKQGFVEYLGTSDTVEREIALADCIVLPSYYKEGIPKSLLEATAMGKPIITTDNIGCRETVIDSYNGFLCEPRSTSSLVNAIEKFIRMSYEERVLFGKRSRERAEKEFDEYIVIEKYLTSIRDVLLENNINKN
ncbi:glycosyltransferase family 4 protein [Xenorhabdus anantnagensis]|uniref:Glycosyltransferase family 4 protein n=1 Tax=Xenorhabdus anantnagensis TaxID=3025875 RepID=A0ABT5LR74_9GAMM|nr:glycosyltransferase family 4 protein [Xenorhabdus anantnagensis]MDC9596815.1 glycosyltransferase family 4 protein [Xenorhabdus anantnagensis]